MLDRLPPTQLHRALRALVHLYLEVQAGQRHRKALTPYATAEVVKAVTPTAGQHRRRDVAAVQHTFATADKLHVAAVVRRPDTRVHAVTLTLARTGEGWKLTDVTSLETETAAR